MSAVASVGLILGSYFFAGIPWGVVLGRSIKGIDIRTQGSGGTGATNSLRLLGWPIAIAVFVLDFLKGMLPVLVARAVDVPTWAVALVALAAVVGHCFSPYIGLKGGKGMATGGGAAIALFPWLCVLILLVVVVVWLTRFVSLGSLVTTVTGVVLMLCLAAIGDFPWAWALGITAIGALIIWQHRSNIRRLLSGTENRFGVRVQHPG